MYIYVVINVFCIVILISMFVHSFQFNNNSKEQWMYRRMLLVSALFVTADMQFFFVKFEVIHINEYLYLVSYGIKRCILAVVSFYWYKYTEVILMGKVKKLGRIRIVLYILIACVLILCTVGGITGFAFDKDKHFEALTGFFSLSMILVGLLKTIKACILDKSDEDKTKYQRAVIFNCYPLLFALGQFFIGGLPLICMGITLSSINSYTIKRLIENSKNIDISSVERFHSLFISSCYVNIEDNTYVFIGDEDNFKVSQSPKYNEMVVSYGEINVHPNDREKFVAMCALENILNRLTQKDSFFFFDYRRRMGTEYKWHRMHIVIAATDENDEPLNVLLSNMYIDDVKQTEYLYQEQLEMASKAKSDFLLNVSHELRTPMNAIMGLTKLLENDIDDLGKVRDDVRKLQASGRHLLSIINDVLDMNQIESGAFVINKARFDLSMLLEDVNTVMLQLTRERKQNFLMELENVKNNFLVGDKARLSQVLLNILTNSTKYTGESGEIRLNVTQLEAEDVCRLRFEISDNGIGMEAEFLERVFEPFAREEARIPFQTSGTGLGMPIVKNIVDLLNGSIRVESEPGVGSTFIVELEFDIALEDTDNVISSDSDNVQSSKILLGRNFLIAEDNEVNGEILTRLLEIEGATAMVCPDGKAVVEAFMENPRGTFDLILMDIRMPVMNGYEAAQAIRNSGMEDGKNIPIISLTANAFSEDVEMAKAAGMNGHVPKPIDMQVLKATVEKVCL